MGQSPDGSTYSDIPSDYILVQGNADLKDGWVCPRIWTTQKTKTADAGDLIMSVRAPAGAMGKTAYDVVLGRGVAGIKGNELIYQLLVKMDSDGYWKKLAAGSTFESINSDAVNKADIVIPQDIEEQQQIGTYFRNLDTLITLHQRKCDSLKKLKKSMLQKMFPKNSSSYPEIRFAGFTDAWEQRELGTIITENLKPVSKPEGEYIRLGIRSHAKGTFHEVVPAGGGLNVDTMYAVEANNLIVNITFAWEEAWAITTDEDAEKLVSHRFPQYKFNSDQYPTFYKYRFNNARMKYDLKLASPGGAGRNRVLNKSAFLKIPICLPMSYEEQQQIGTYFRNLDTLITLHQRKLETLKKLKKSMLQKMFI